MYISYADYQDAGGMQTEAAFSSIERRAEAKLNFYTQNRIKALSEIPQVVKDVMLEFCFFLESSSSMPSNLSSYSNGVESFGFNTSADPYGELYRIAVEMLPIELISAQVD
jgi:hypothetical protein